MTQRVIEWETDDKARKRMYQGLEKLSSDLADKAEGEKVLDVGGMGGKLGHETELKEPVCIDLAPNTRFDDVHYVKGNMLNMPFPDDTFDLVLAKAVLHHVPENLDEGLKELYRVTKKGGKILIEEPTSNNPFASLSRKLFTTAQHDEHEEPLEPKKLQDIVKRYYDSTTVKPFFFFSYLAPHFISRLPGSLKEPARIVTSGVLRVDETILREKSILKNRCAYLAIIGKKS